MLFFHWILHLVRYALANWQSRLRHRSTLGLDRLDARTYASTELVIEKARAEVGVTIIG